jgi:fatty-acyl-CoA synthase
MSNLIWKTDSAYGYPLLIKNLLRTPIVDRPDQEIVYRGEKRFTYRQFRDRIGRLASALTRLGVKPGDTVAVMDWDSHRYLECFYAVPMIGAVLHTVNVRLPAEQLVYTIGHAEDDVILVNAEFLRSSSRSRAASRP